MKYEEDQFEKLPLQGEAVYTHVFHCERDAWLPQACTREAFPSARPTHGYLHHLRTVAKFASFVISVRLGRHLAARATPNKQQATAHAGRWAAKAAPTSTAHHGLGAQW